MAHLPDVPTLEEQGYPGIWLTNWTSIVVPVGTPSLIVDKLADAFEEALHDPRAQKYAKDNDGELMVGMKKEKFRDLIIEYQSKLRTIVEKAKISLD